MSSLYLAHFGLNKPPFQITPDLGFFFAGGRRGDILSALLHVAQHEEGIMTLVAEVGSGKTLLARLMLSKLAADICTIYLANPSFSRDEILGAIARELGLTDLPVSTEARLAALHHELLRRHALGQRVLLVIDEAHAMPPESLEEVRLLSNLETDQHKLLNIMLFGQPELDETLADRRMRQVRDRVIHRFQLTPLPAEEAAAYVDHRLRAAGWSGGALFAPPAMALLIKSSGGRARRINLLADKALLGAYASGKATVQVEQVRNAVAELHDDIVASARWRVPGWPWGAAALIAALAVGGAAFLGPRSADFAPQLQGPPAQSVPATGPASVPRASVPTPVSAPTPTLPASTPAAALSATEVATPAWMSTLSPYLARTQAHLQSTEATGYTLQIAALPREAPVLAYLSTVGQSIDSAQIYAQLSHYNGKDFVAVFIGSYPSATAATAALNTLPAALKANKPIVRTWKKIRQDQLS
ncbi:MAG: ATPase [Burkholderiales bacterium PBB4]|nr:MAG: ATPase [Burkholderiales bacterium PBB4]